VEAVIYVYAVVFSNYEPPEVAALYDNVAAAEAHADALDDDGDWRVVRWHVASRYGAEAPAREGPAPDPTPPARP
jgi:hypothetical protein